jgi:nitroreductase
MATNEQVEAAKQAPSASNLHEIIGKRWSPRAFSDKPVSPKDLKSLLEAAHWAASSFNEQPWRFILGRRGDATYQKILDTLVPFNQDWAKSAPILVLTAAKKTFSHNGSPNYYGLHDTGAASATLALQAASLGLHTHSMAGFNHDKARADFKIPEDFDIGAVTAVGYFGDPETLPDGLKKQEISGRTRKPLSDVVFSEWETPAAL